KRKHCDRSSIVALTQIEHGDRNRLGARGEQQNRGGKLAYRSDEDEDPGGDDAVPYQRRRDIEQSAQPRGAKDAARVLELRVNRFERCADLLITDRKLLGQIGEEDDRQGSVENERRLRVGEKQADGEHNAGNGDWRRCQKAEIAMSPDEL